MNYYDILLAKKLNKKSGGDVDVESLVVTENGTYTESGKAYSPVVVNVPLPNNAYLLKSENGNVISITDGAEFNLAKCDVNIELVQSGSGEPSPENVRSIRGFSSVVITQKNDVTNPTVTKTHTIQLGQTVYGGNVDFTTGKMVVDKAYIEYVGSNDENWNKLGAGASGDYTFYIPLSGVKYVNGNIAPNIKTNYLKAIPYNDNWGNYDNFISKNPNTDNLYTAIQGITSVADWKTYLTNNPLTVVYELTTPITIQLTPTQIKLLENNNVIYADSGDIAIEYFGKGVSA